VQAFHLISLENTMNMRARFTKSNMLAGAIALIVSGLAWSADTIKIGDINSYKSQPVFTDGYKKGMELAVEQINAAGGVDGKKL
jgi:branched-chain amino acid transport system substrate-binding protein